jgi:hypothetical protein
MILNIIDQIYSNSHFTALLIGAIAFLIVLFIVVLYMGVKDAKKAKEPVVDKKEEKDITFEELTEEQNEVAEDVTFEMPTISKDLEDLKKGVEEELKNIPDTIEDVPEVVENVEDLDKTTVMETVGEFRSPDEDFDDVEDDFLDLIRDKEEKEPVLPVEEPDIPISLTEVDNNKDIELPEVEIERNFNNDNTMEIELPAKNKNIQHDSFNSDERRKRERMLDDYLTATQALSLDAIQEKLKEYEDDDF